MTSAAKANRRADIVDRLEAENERLRAALQKIIDTCGFGQEGGGDDAYEIARAAMQPLYIQQSVDVANEIKRLRATLYQIATVCKDNANAIDRGKAMALDFVHQVAAGAVNIHKHGET